MTLRTRIWVVILGALAMATILAACGPSTTDIVLTTTAQNQIDNATAQAETAVARGGGGGVFVGEGSLAQRVQQTAQAKVTMTAEAGGGGDFCVGSECVTVPGSEDVEIPDGPAQSGSVTVEITVPGAFEPAVIKILPGTTVVWETSRRSATSTTSDGGQEEMWDSGTISKGTFDKEPKRFDHTFNTVGCFKYHSVLTPDRGAVCVVAE